MTPDPFGTAAVRERVLAGWAAAPVRFREDANAEEELVLGGYRDRLVVELAQNAADAALRAGVPGRLLLAVRELDGGAVLVAANTGAMLDADGVQALATLRASSKRDEDGDGAPAAVGRFGVGFAAVLAVTDSPAVLSRSGGVRFSGPDTRALVEQAAGHSPGLHDELARRDGHVPVLRLPFEAEGSPPDGYDTAVLLPLRDAAAEDLVVRLLDEVADPLLLALPALQEVVVDLPGRPPRTVAEVAGRWRVHTRAGRFDPGLLADRPTEERRRTGWQVTWALPAAAGVRPPAVLHAPTSSDEPLAWPALLIGGFPLDSSRRHVAPGPATDLLVREAARGYAELLARCAQDGVDVLPLVPTGLAAGELDGALRAAVLELLPELPLLPEGGPDGDPDGGSGGDADLDEAGQLEEGEGRVLVRPRDAVALDPPAGAAPGLVRLLARRLAGLVLAPRPAAAALAALGIRRMSLADLVEALPAVHDPPYWHRLYGALDPLAVDPLVREALADLPVPLADGRVVRGARGVLLTPDADPRGGAGTGADGWADGWADGGVAGGAGLELLGIRAVHPQAAHPLLERLGGTVTGAGGILDLPAVRAAVQAAAQATEDGDDPQPVVDAVLGLVAAAVAAGEAGPDGAGGGTAAPGEGRGWLADLPLPADDGGLSPAGALALPGSVAAGLFDPDEIGLVAPELLERWGAGVLVAAGVLAGPALLRAADVPLDPDGGDEAADEADDPGSLDGWPEWVEEVRAAVQRDGAADGAADPGALPVLAELLAVRDLDAVPDDALPRLVEVLAADPRLRPAVVGPARVLTGGTAVDVPPYTAWWLRDRIAGGSGPLLDPEADPLLHGLFPAAPAWLTGLDDGIRRALAAVRTVADLGPEGAAALARRLADPAVEVPLPVLLRCWHRLAELGAAGVEVEPGERVRALDGAGGSVVVPADRAVVVDTPMHRQRTDLGAALVVPPGLGAGLADLLDLPLARDLVAGDVDERGARRAPVPAAVLDLLPAAPVTWCEHEDGLLVDGADVAWWVSDGDDPAGGTASGSAGGAAGPVVHAATLQGLAEGTAWAAGAWASRLAVAQALVEPGSVSDLLVDAAFG